MAAALGFVLALACASGLGGLGDPDAFSHLSYTRRLVESGFRLRGHPFLPFTVLGDAGVDLWWGFHLLLVPFVPFGDLWGARLAGACIAATVAGSLAWLLVRLGRPISWPFALAPLALSFHFLLRGHVARPAHLTIPILLFQLAAGAGELHPAWAAGLAFVHGMLHSSSPLAPLFAGLGLLGARLVGGRGSPRSVLWAVGGLALALLVRPDRDLYATIAALHNLVALDLLGSGHLPHAGREALAPDLTAFLLDVLPGFALLALALALGRGQPRSGSRSMRLSALFGTAACFVLSLQSVRFLDYLVPLQAMTAALFWPKASNDGTSRARQLGVVAMSALAVVLFGRNLLSIAQTIPRFFDEPPTFARLAEAVRKRVPPGAVLFTDDPFVTEILLSTLPEYRYLLAYDSSLLWLENPQRFYRWHHAVVAGIDCARPVCAPRAPSGAEVARVIHSFDSSWAITSYPRGRLSAQETMARDPGRFELAAIVPGTATGLYLWRVR